MQRDSVLHSPAATLPQSTGLRVTLARVAAGFTAAVGVAVLVGWWLNMPALRSVVSTAAEMKANTALGIVASSVALWLSAVNPVPSGRRQLAGVLCTLVVALGLATLSQYLFDWNLGIDEALVRDTSSASHLIKGRMSPYTTLALIALGVAIGGLWQPRFATLARVGAALSGAIGVMSVIGYLWNSSELVTDRWAPPMALNTSICFVLLGGAVLLLNSPSATDPPRRARSRLELMVLGGFIPTVVFVLVGGGITYESGASFAQAAERASRAHEIRGELGRLYGAIVDAQTARRTQVLTLNLAYEQEYRAKVADLRKHIAAMARLVADNAPQAERLKRMTTLVDERIRVMDGVAPLFNTKDDSAARAYLAADAGSPAMRAIRDLRDAMDDAEIALLQERLSNAAVRRQTTLLSLLATLAAVIGLSVLMFKGIGREMQARTAAEDDLHRLNADLEKRVALRTAELEYQQTFLRRVIDLNHNLIFAKDAHGRYVLANQAFADVLQTTVEALMGVDQRELHLTSGEVEQFASADRAVIESGQELVIDEEPLTNAAGETRWFNTIKRPMLSADGASTIVLGVGTDITQRKAAEDEIRKLNIQLEARVDERTRELYETNFKLQEARLESDSANRAKSAFLATMSHEIRTPMNAIIGLTHLMARESIDDLQRQRLKRVGDAAQHLLQVINDILDISKIEAGKLALDETEFSVDDLLLGAVEMVSTRALDKGLEVIVDRDHLPERLRGDRMRISQILINLLSNAVKFTEHGWVRLRGEVRNELPGERIEVRFEVQDTGPGIATEQQKLLFNAFVQADATISRLHGGSGLGLALSRELARAMGGDAGVSSAPGAGSSFWFTAVLQKGEEARPRTPTVKLTGLRALLVDDLSEARLVVGESLRTMGMEVDAVDSGAAALERITAVMAIGRPYDVMFIDWNMEPMDGIQTLTAIRKLLGDGIPRSVLITAFDDVGVTKSAKAAHFSAVMVKPVTVSSLNDTLSELIHPREAGVSTVHRDESLDAESLLRARHAGQRVLLAEDNPVNREVAEELLHSAGLKVETAWDGARAVEMALSRHYDLVLMDMQMPRMDGLEAARAIREKAGRSLPIIAMTANAYVEDRAACLDAGMNDHVAKPVNPATLYKTVLRWMPLRNSDSTGQTAPGELAVPLPVTDAVLLERLRQIEGLDVDTAMRFVGRQAPVLVRALRRMVMTYRDGLPQLLDKRGSESDVASRRQAVCHSMKGALGTVGAAAMLAQVDRLERALAAQPAAPSTDEEARRLHEAMIAMVLRLEHAFQA